ncbi:DUF4157 domain-containing protein [candidate division KSB1 bacterium]|nr:DUF4157 domain-containing protein [candidate division KSB1 bacterium]
MKSTFTPVRSGLPQRKCACGNSAGLDGECKACRNTRLSVQRRDASETELATVPRVVHEASQSSGHPLDPTTRAVMEPHFGHDFSEVRIHTDARAAESAQAVNALAYTVGQNIVFGANQYAPGTMSGQKILAHELTHTIQQSTAKPPVEKVGNSISSTQRPEIEAEQAALNAVAGQVGTNFVTERPGLTLQRQTHGTTSPISVRSPVFEELVTQASTVGAAISGRPLTSREAELARGVFANSIDYSRVTLIPTDILEYRTIGNTIRVPDDFTIADAGMAETFIHEMTHVWQYQHGGTSYISVSLATQIAGAIGSGSRNAAYDYQIAPDKSFFDFLPEQQGLMVENYFAMLRDRSAPRDARRYRSNHLDSSGNFYGLLWNERQTEINRELPLHDPLIDQLRAALPRPEIDLLNLRASEVIRTPFEETVPEELRLPPIKPILEIRF